jgi:hypothetical protein
VSGVLTLRGREGFQEGILRGVHVTLHFGGILHGAELTVFRLQILCGKDPPRLPCSAVKGCGSSAAVGNGVAGVFVDADDRVGGSESAVHASIFGLSESVRAHIALKPGVARDESDPQSILEAAVGAPRPRRRPWLSPPVTVETPQPLIFVPDACAPRP